MASHTPFQVPRKRHAPKAPAQMGFSTGSGSSMAAPSAEQLAKAASLFDEGGDDASLAAPVPAAPVPVAPVQVAHTLVTHAPVAPVQVAPAPAPAAPAWLLRLLKD